MSFDILWGIKEQLGGVCSSAYEVSLFKVAFFISFLWGVSDWGVGEPFQKGAWGNFGS